MRDGNCTEEEAEVTVLVVLVGKLMEARATSCKSEGVSVSSEVEAGYEYTSEVLSVMAEVVAGMGDERLVTMVPSATPTA